jgi:hypothetical protein
MKQTLEALARTACKEAGKAVIGTLSQEVLRDSPELQQLASLAIRTGAARLEGVTHAEVLQPKFDLQRWLRADSILAKDLIQPLDIVERFRELRANLGPICEHLLGADPSLGRMLEQETARRLACEGPGDIESANAYLAKRPVGLVAERLVQAVFEPLFERTLPQVYAELTESYSIVDQLFEGAKRPLMLGANKVVAQGGNLLAEVKTGKPEYLLGQLNHLTLRQIPGHKVFDGGSIVVASADFKDLGVAEEPFRNSIRDAGSRVFTFLPRKASLDALLRDVIEARVKGTQS